MADEKIVDEIRWGKNNHMHCWNLRGANLSYADLSYSELRSDFSGAELEGIDFLGVKLGTADLRGVKLDGAEFSVLI